MARRFFRKAQPTVQDVHINRPLTDMSVAYLQQPSDFVADKVFPFVPVANKSDSYYVYERADFYRSQAQKRADSTESAGSGYALGTQTYNCENFAIHKNVSDNVRANSDAALRPDMEATTFVTQQLQLVREVEWMAAYFQTGVWPSETTPAILWDAAGSTPIQDIRAAIVGVKEATGYLPNTITMDPRTWQVLSDHPDMQDRIKYTQTGILTQQLFAAIVDVPADRVFVAWGVQNTAAEGATEANSFLAGKGLLISYAPPSPGLMTPSAGYTFGWTGLLGSGAFANRIKRFRMEQLSADRVEGELSFDLQQVGPDLAHFFLAPIS